MHAGVVIAEHDREALERLCHYGTRPAFAQERLAWTADGQIAYRLKRPWPDGRTELVLPPVAFLRRLCGIIPATPSPSGSLRGVFGPASQRRARLRMLVPAPADEPPPDAATPSGAARAGRVPWAELLRRVFATDVLSCPFGGRRCVVPSSWTLPSLDARGAWAAVHPGDLRAERELRRRPSFWFDDARSPRSPTRPAKDGSAPTSTQRTPEYPPGIR